MKADKVIGNVPTVPTSLDSQPEILSKPEDLMTVEDLLEEFRTIPIEWYRSGPDSLSLRPRAAVTERIRVAVRVYKPALMWLVARRLPPGPERPLSEAWLTRMDFQSWENYKARQDWGAWKRVLNIEGAA